MFRSKQNDRNSVTVFIDDEPCTALDGEMVVVVLMRENMTATHVSPQGQPRGPYCMMGVCYDCMITLEDGRNEQACLTPVEEGLKIYRRSSQTHGGSR